jgi:WD40 repeat protein
MTGFGASHAVCIGIDDYSGGISALRTAAADARAIANVVREQHGYRLVEPANDAQATKAGLTALFDSLIGSVGADDRLFVYFAGHGVAKGDEEQGPQGYLLPHDADPYDELTWLSMRWLRAALDRLPCRHVLVVLDCCFAGSFRWASMRDAVLTPDRLFESQFQRFLAGKAWQVLTSATHDERASDIAPWRQNFRDGDSAHSPFAEALLRGLAGDADAARGGRTPDGVITASDLYLYIYQYFHEQAGIHAFAQTPGIWPLKLDNDAEYVFLNPEHALETAPDPPLDDEQNPWLGLRTYNEEHAEIFFGRRRATQEVYALSRRANPVVVLGSSGSGKSSLVRAGLIPKLRRDGVTIIGPNRPGSNPMTLFESLPPAEGGSSVLVIDQLEEVYTHCRDAAERDRFLDALSELISGGERVIVTLRSDFEPRLAASKFGSHLGGGRYLVPQFELQDYRQIIEGPAAARALYFEPPAIQDRLVSQVVAMPGGMPLLSFALGEMYRQSVLRRRITGARDRTLNEQDYEAAGDVLGALHKRADEVFSSATRAERRTMRRLFLRLVSIEAGQRVRRAVSHQELDFGDSLEQRRLSRILSILIESTRLLVADEHGVEASHDTLVVSWVRLDRWLDEDMESALALHRVWRGASAWDAGGQKPAQLWPDYPRVAWFIDPKQRQLLNRLEQSFLEQSEALRQARAGELEYERDRARDANLMNSARRELADPTRVVQFLREVKYYDDTRGWYSMARSALAQPIAWTTIHSRSPSYALSRDERRLVATGIDGAVHIVRLDRARDHIVLRHPGEEQRVRFSLSPDGRRIATVSFDEAQPDAAVWRTDRRGRGRPLSGHESDLLTPQFSADGQWIFTGSSEGVGRLWRPDVRHTMLLGGGDDPTVYSVAISPDGRWLATTTADEMVRLLPLAEGPEPILLEGHDGLVLAVDFSSNGRSLVSASMDQTARVWDLAEPGRAVVLKGHSDWLRSAAFSPNGRSVLTTSDDRTARIWSVDRRGKVVVLESDERLNCAVFHPHGTSVATAAEDGVIRMWRLDRPAKPAVLELPASATVAAFSPDGRRLAIALHDGDVAILRLDREEGRRALGRHSDEVRSIAFSPDGTWVLTASDDQTIRLWPASRRDRPRVLRSHDGGVNEAVFSADGRWIASAADDGTARIRSASGRSAPRIVMDFRRHPDRAIFSAAGSWALLHDIYGKGIHLFRLNGETRAVVIPGKLESAVFSQDGETLAMLIDDGTLTVRRLSHPDRPQFLSRPGKRIKSIALSPNGCHVVAAFTDGLAQVWNVGEAGEPVSFRLHKRALNHAAFSADGAWIVTASVDGTAAIQKLDKSEQPIRLEGHNGEVEHAEFAPDGKSVLSVSEDGSARIWSRDRVPTSTVLRNLGQPISEASFSQNGRWVATASDFGPIRVWDAHRAPESRALFGHQGQITQASFSRDGRRVLTLGRDRTIRIWQAGQPSDPIVLASPRSWFDRAQFSPDGDWILTVSGDRSARLWRLGGDDEPVLLKGSRYGAKFAAFAPGGEYVITMDLPGTVRTHAVAEEPGPGVVRGHGEYVSASPDGRRLVIAGSSGVVIVNFDDSEATVRLDCTDVGNDSIRSARFSPDGNWILGKSHWVMPRLWRADGSGPARRLERDGYGAKHVAFRLDGHLATVARGVLRVELPTGGRSTIVTKDLDSLSYLGFDPPGGQVVLGMENGDLELWPLTPGGTPSGESTKLPGNGTRVDECRFSPDGGWILVNPGEKPWLWRTDGSCELITPDTPEGPVQTAEFSPDGMWLLTTSNSGVARISRWRSPDEMMQAMWEVTQDCPEPGERMEMFGASAEAAERDYRESRNKVRVVTPRDARRI